MTKHNVTVLFCLLATVILLAGCDAFFSDDNGDSNQGSAIEQAFLEAMVPHHQMAIDMAEIAQERSTIAEIEAIADDIVANQGGEITQLEQIHQRIFGSALVPDEMAHERLGLTAEEAGMHMDMGMLQEADPFDREFIDMMIPHHEGAIRMAEVVLEDTGDSELRALANSIISDQTAEIQELSDIREEHYGEGNPGH
jgi:uncharacterized protein (DUF305 family)